MTFIEYWFANPESSIPELRFDWSSDIDEYRGIMDALAARQIGFGYDD